MRLPPYLLSLLVFGGLLLSAASACQQQPTALNQPPAPGTKEGETPPVELDKRVRSSARDNDTTPLPPATTPATTGDPNSPGAPLPPASAPVTPAPTPEL